MTLAPLFLAILIYATMLWSPCSAVVDVYYYNSNERQGRKIKMLARELVIDADMKIRAVQRYRDQYYKSLQYQLGDVVYEMRDYYKKMVRLFQDTEKNISYSYLNHNENVKTFILIERMAIEIEYKAAMILEWQYKRASAQELKERMTDPLRTGSRGDGSQELLRERAARMRMARAGVRVARPPPPEPRTRRTPAPAPPPTADTKRKNNKWQCFGCGISRKL